MENGEHNVSLSLCFFKADNRLMLSTKYVTFSEFYIKNGKFVCNLILYKSHKDL